MLCDRALRYCACTEMHLARETCLILKKPQCSEERLNLTGNSVIKHCWGQVWCMCVYVSAYV